MPAKPTMMLAILVVTACSAQSGSPPHTAAAAPEPPPGAEREQPAPAPSATLKDADRLYLSQLGATRGGQFEVDRQLAELRQAKLLYEQFLERAGEGPELEPAVRKSRERIVDLEQTIEFLEGSRQAEGDRAPK